MLRGPLTDDEVRQIVEVVKDAEERRPDETFTIAVDDPESDADAQELLDAINPLRAGYERMVKYRRNG